MFFRQVSLRTAVCQMCQFDTSHYSGVLHHRRLDNLLIRLFRSIKVQIKAPRHWPLCGEFTGDRWIPRAKASSAENVSIWWRHHVLPGSSLWSAIGRYISAVPEAVKVIISCVASYETSSTLWLYRFNAEDVSPSFIFSISDWMFWFTFFILFHSMLFNLILFQYPVKSKRWKLMLETMPANSRRTPNRMRENLPWRWDLA